MRKFVRNNCRILDKVGSHNSWRLIKSVSKDKQPASPVNVDVNNLNRYFNSFSNDTNGQPHLEKTEFPVEQIPCFYHLEVYHYLKKQKQTSHESSGLAFWSFTYAAETLADLFARCLILSYSHALSLTFSRYLISDPFQKSLDQHFRVIFEPWQ